MDELLRKLHDDHLKIARVLAQLERDFTSGDPAALQQTAKLSQLDEALQFVVDYPKHWHHPIEHLIFQKLLDKGVAEKEAVETVMAEHESMESAFGELIERFQQAINSAEPPSEELLADIRAFIDYELDHQHRESTQVYPLFSQYLEEKEWQEILQMTYQVPHNQAIQQHFAAMYNRLQRSSS